MLGQGRLIKGIIVFSALTLVLSACSSNRKKYEQRDKVAASSGLFCDFVNGDKFKDVEVELNLNMAKKCDPEKPYSVSGYKNASDVHGLVYCCNMKRIAEAQPKVQPVPKKETEAPQAPKSDASPNPKSRDDADITL